MDRLQPQTTRTTLFTPFYGATASQLTCLKPSSPAAVPKLLKSSFHCFFREVSPHHSSQDDAPSPQHWASLSLLTCKPTASFARIAPRKKVQECSSMPCLETPQHQQKVCLAPTQHTYPVDSYCARCFLADHTFSFPSDLISEYENTSFCFMGSSPK